jgi:NTE family protein
MTASKTSPQAAPKSGSIESQPALKIKSAATAPSIGLALGGGGARGLAHIVMLEAFDELGIKPAIISGTSIGAMYGAAYASGISAKDIRAHTKEVLAQRFSLVRDLFAARSQPFQRLLNPFAARTAILDPEAVLDLVMPKGVMASFKDLRIPLKIVASDFYDQEPVVFTDGPLRMAVAASMALPVIFQPVMFEGRALIDGGLTNPLPFDLLAKEADIIVAIDVTGIPVADPKRPSPTAFEALFASAFLFESSIVKEKLKASKPDILISSGTSRYQVLDFLKVDEILAAAEPAKERLKAQLDRVLSVETLPQLEAVDGVSLNEELERSRTPKISKRRGLLKRRDKNAEQD